MLAVDKLDKVKSRLHECSELDNYVDSRAAWPIDLSLNSIPDGGVDEMAIHSLDNSSMSQEKKIHFLSRRKIVVVTLL